MNLNLLKPGWLPGFFFATLFSLISFYSQAGNNPAALIIIIDDIGNNRSLGERTVNLPGPLNLAFLPHTPFARSLADKAHQSGHTVMLHTPMANKTDARLGPGAMTMDMDKHQWQQVLHDNLLAIPHVRGVNNHMGSLLTEQPDAMAAVMETLQQQGLFFVDSLTTANSVAQQQAIIHGLPNLQRDIFLDNDVAPMALKRQFDKAIKLAKRRGVAVVIGHPYPETLTLLETELGNLSQSGVQLHSAQQYLYDRLWKAVPSPSSRYQLQPFNLPALQSVDSTRH